MASLTLNLYPPVLETYMPAFVISANSAVCKVYFELSDYNSIENIANAQVLVTNQNNNLTVLDISKYPSEIMLKEIQNDANGYYIEINTTDINGGFINDTNYKVQIRFTSWEAFAGSTIEAKQADKAIKETIPQGISTWLTENLDNFSEWSRACLIYGISEHDIVAYYNIVDGSTITKTRWNSGTPIDWTQSNVVTFIGNMVYADPNETEYIQSYYIELHEQNGLLVENSGNSYPNNNTFNYTFKTRLRQGETYYFDITYTTISQYTRTVRYGFQIIHSGTTDLRGILNATPDDENGCMYVQFKDSGSGSSATIDILIRRSSSKDNFAFEDDMYIIKDYQWTGNNSFTYADKTIENGIFYRYTAQIIDAQGFLGRAITTDKQLVSTDYAYINSADKQLALKFDSTVSSLKKVLTESITNTLGAKYPFIKRNGDVNYYQFPISGLITYRQDDIDWFTSLEEIYQDSMLDHDIYNNNHNISNERDYNYEKLYRKKVYDFLTDGQVKLFRGPAEGNFLIRLTDVSLTPNQQLGRMVWSFSATATEIADYTIDNLKKYNVLNFVAATIPSEVEESWDDSLLRIM